MYVRALMASGGTAVSEILNNPFNVTQVLLEIAWVSARQTEYRHKVFSKNETKRHRFVCKFCSYLVKHVDEHLRHCDCGCEA